MSYYIQSFIECVQLQRSLDGVFGCDYTMTNKLNETSLVQFLRSPANTNNVLQNQISPGGGKIRQVELIYQPRIAKGAVITSIDRENCTSDNVEGNLSTTYDIDENVGVQWDFKIKDSDLRRVCQDDGLYIQKQLARGMNAMVRRMDAELSDDIIALAGAFGPGATNSDGTPIVGDTKTVKTQVTGLANSYDLVSEIDFDADNAAWCGAPYLFGYHELYKYFKKLDANCCADQGINVAELAAQSGIRFIPNRNIPSSLGDPNKFISLDAGQVQLLTYLAYQNTNLDANDHTYSEMTIEHPEIAGLKFDLRITKECGVWSFFLSLAFKIVGIPNDLYQAEDIYSSSITGVNKYRIAN
jgi:hypothetical protein